MKSTIGITNISNNLDDAPILALLYFTGQAPSFVQSFKSPNQNGEYWTKKSTGSPRLTWKNVPGKSHVMRGSCYANLKKFDF